MKHQSVEYFDGPQKLIGEWVFAEEGPDQRPAILIFPAFEGRGPFTLDYAENFAKQGYAVFVADMYGNAEVAQTLDRCFELLSPFLKDRSLVRRRASLAHVVVKQSPMVRSQKIGAMGFCFGGMCVLELARSGEDLAAGVSAHGVLTASNLPTAAIRSHLLILHGYRDPQTAPDALSLFAEEVDAAGAPSWVFTFFGDAKHAFTDPATGSFDAAREQKMGREYNRLAAERAFRYASDFFTETLK
jgi:dienelactone hydrolase